ncbi:MAG: methyltransferase domain-containing protein [Planctomycetota bacterium]|nr:methyltransferase domain-containing protein [Planctomycetota bacterium]
MNESTWRFACPECKQPLSQEPSETARLHCAGCGEGYAKEDGIWRFITEPRLEPFHRFLGDYVNIRLAEGRGSDSADYYLKLPDCDPRHPIAWQWQLRQKTFARFRSKVLPELPNSAKLLDVGAGVGWFSHRLGQDGCEMCAVDVCVDDKDGLAAARHYQPDWPRVQAEFDRLPFADASVDGVVFNASFHYSTDPVTTLCESMRVLRDGGVIVILESPIYRHEHSGRQMVEQRHQDFARRFGTRSDSLDSIQFLTWSGLQVLASQLNLTWRIDKPWYGWRWAARPWKAKLMRRREPSQFAILTACVNVKHSD